MRPPAAPGGPGDHERPTILEMVLQCDRCAMIALLVVAPALCWTWIVVLADDMYGPMTNVVSRMMMRMAPAWDAPHVLVLYAMWVVMMTAMMLPSASPLLLLYGAAARRSAEPAAGRRIYALAAGYLFVWMIFSFGASALQSALAALLLVSPMMQTTRPAAGGILLLIAGVHQLTPFKEACLRACRSPLGFLMTRWRGGWSGAFGMGFEHGVYCVGCCWALMLLLFVGGVMNLAIIAALTAFVAFEKLTPFGQRSVRLNGFLLIAFGFWMLARSR